MQRVLDTITPGDLERPRSESCASEASERSEAGSDGSMSDYFDFEFDDEDIVPAVPGRWPVRRWSSRCRS
jgi:hypothetical protein